ncbi:MAG: HNH endonuclease [Deltaproteobacteria bacterium]|nr:HNH endonuclease [Deltaproteobacteria bacterium]
MIFNPDQKIKRRNHNIEHFYPKKPEKPEDEMEKEVVDNIGNLLVISFRTNSKLGSLSPKKKLEKLEGDCAKDIENMLYVQEFINKYKKSIPSWGNTNIESRAKELAKLSYRKVWKIS